MKQKLNIKPTILLIISILLSDFCYSQNYNPLQKPNTFQSTENPFYWKNRKPFKGYWQQDVNYMIIADIDEKTDIITGILELEYTNNSPDSLPFVYFHLYQNAFQPNSYYHQLHISSRANVRFGKYEKQGLGTKIDSITFNGKKVRIELDNTILKVYLPKALKSQSSGTFFIQFQTFFDTGSMRRRMKVFDSYGAKQYNGVHWYPRISVYDRKFGWTTDQHLGREFYGDFGTFDVNLIFANNYIVEATGYLTNRKEVLPDSLRKKLDLSNFDTTITSPSVIVPYDSTLKKTWSYHAENVHDFAFTANPHYRIGESEWNGIKCIAVVPEPNAKNWIKSTDFGAKVIETYSKDFGMYGYHKLVIADAKDGMEYPMITLDNGSYPQHKGLLAHEMGHNWFFGQVGNNETYRAAMDEGFTQFLTAWSLVAIDGDTMDLKPSKKWYYQKFQDARLAKFLRVDYGYLSDAMRHQDAKLNTHSDDFNSAIRHGGGYHHVYYKTASMLYNLQYVLGDSLFKAAMQNYFKQWKFAHPYIEDFRNSIIQYTKVDLNWFFDQWLTTSKNIDYSIKSVNKLKDNKYQLTIKRKGSMQMPIDFSVYTDNGKKQVYHIPNTWFVKQSSATILPKWTGWGKLNSEYTTIIESDTKIKNIIIDESGRLSDINRLNNFKKLPIELKFDSKVANYPKWDKYEVFWRPEVWYNGIHGTKIGFHLNSNYMRYRHNVNFTTWYNTGLGTQSYTFGKYTGFRKLNYRLTYSTGINKISPKTDVFISTKLLDGLESYKAGIIKQTNDGKGKFQFYFKSMIRKRAQDTYFLYQPIEWISGNTNNTVNLNFTHNIPGNTLKLKLKNSAFGSYDFSKLSLENVTKSLLGKLDIQLRLFAQYGAGSNWARESQLAINGANPEEMQDNKYSRSIGFTPTDNLTNFNYGGGLNLRGYAYSSGTSGASASLEVDFERVFGFKPRILKNYHLDTYLFADLGTINSIANQNTFSKIATDAGFGTALTVKKFWLLQKVKPLTIRFDIPFYLSQPPIGGKNIDYRWLVGVSRSF